MSPIRFTVRVEVSGRVEEKSSAVLSKKTCLPKSDSKVAKAQSKQCTLVRQ